MSDTRTSDLSSLTGSARDAAGCDRLGFFAQDRFGISYIYPYQRLVMANILDAATEGGEHGESQRLRQIVLLPTGFGKSLCFQLPSLFLRGPTLVVYPLLALMEDQRRSLAARNIAAAVFRGGMDERERREAEKSLERGEAKIIITNPESLGGRRLSDFLAELRPAHVVIDEAHCVVEWGQTFRQSYLELGPLLERLDPPAASAFTATAGPRIASALADSLFGGEPVRIIEGDPDRPNIYYGVEKTLSRGRTLNRLVTSLEKPLVVFASSRETVQITARRLAESMGRHRLRFYHAGLERAEKKDIERWFYDSNDGVLVATCAYGMGVDKKNIRSVLHFEPPSSIEAYLQESGRAGRDGLPAVALLMIGPDDADKLRRIQDEGRRERFRALLDYGQRGSGCRRKALLRLLLGSGAEASEKTDDVVCGGCDRCDGRARESYEGEREISAFVRSNPRRFTRAETFRLIRGREGSARNPSRCPGWGSLHSWAEEETAAAFALAAGMGLVRERPAHPWKNRLEPGPALRGKGGAD